MCSLNQPMVFVPAEGLVSGYEFFMGSHCL